MSSKWCGDGWRFWIMLLLYFEDSKVLFTADLYWWIMGCSHTIRCKFGKSIRIDKTTINSQAFFRFGRRVLDSAAQIATKWYYPWFPNMWENLWWTFAQNKNHRPYVKLDVATVIWLGRCLGCCHVGLLSFILYCTLRAFCNLSYSIKSCLLCALNNVYWLLMSPTLLTPQMDPFQPRSHVTGRCGIKKKLAFFIIISGLKWLRITNMCKVVKRKGASAHVSWVSWYFYTHISEGGLLQQDCKKTKK